jgi:hypothetical protein
VPEVASATLVSPPPAPAIITQAQSGRTYRLANGREVSPRLSGWWAWTEPRPSAPGLRLTAVEYFRDPGFSEWRVAATGRGTFSVRSVGMRGGAARRFVVTIRSG